MGFVTKILIRLFGGHYGKKLSLKGFCFVFGRISVGSNVTIRSAFLSNLLGLNHRTIIVSRRRNTKVEIGDNVGISGATIYAVNEITIGRNTLIGANTKIFDTDFHPLDSEARRIDDRSRIKCRPVRIGSDCFIGCDALILKGTELGSGCVVGAGAVVAGKFPRNSVIAGNPARVVRMLESYGGGYCRLMILRRAGWRKAVEMFD